jgi:hypothetical protein
MSQWVQNLIPFFVLVPILLLFFGLYFSRIRRAQRQNAATLERNWRLLDENLKAANRQADAMERIAAALETKHPS